MSCINHVSQTLLTNDEAIQAKLNSYMQRITELQSLLAKEEKQVIAFLKLNKQALNNENYTNCNF